MQISETQCRSYAMFTNSACESKAKQYSDSFKGQEKKRAYKGEYLFCLAKVIPGFKRRDPFGVIRNMPGGMTSEDAKQTSAEEEFKCFADSLLGAPNNSYMDSSHK